MARAFNGSSYLSAASIPGAVGSAARTVACWVKTTIAVSNRQFFYSEGDESGSYTRFALEIESSQFKFNVRSASMASGFTPTINTWHHVCIIFQGSQNFRFFVDGVLRSASNTPGVLATAGNNFNIGRYYGGSLPLTGEMAEVAKWDIAITDREAVALYKQRAAHRVYPGQLSFCLKEVGSSFFDYSRTKLALTDNGPTTYVTHVPVFQ